MQRLQIEAVQRAESAVKAKDEAESSRLKALAEKQKAKDEAEVIRRKMQWEDPLASRPAEWRFASIQCHITDFITSCDELRNLKNISNRLNEFTDEDQLAYDAIVHWFGYFTPDIKQSLLDQLMSDDASTNPTETTPLTIDV